MIATLFLGLAILVPTAGFSFLNVALWRPEPHVRAPEQLVRIYSSDFRSQPADQFSAAYIRRVSGNQGKLPGRSKRPTDWSPSTAELIALSN